MTESRKPTEEETSELRQLVERLGGEVSEVGRWIEIVSAFLLSAAVDLSAFSAWQATLWGGKQSISFAEASSSRAQSNRELAIALTEIAYDVGAFVDASIIFAEGDEEALEIFDERLFRDEFKPALEAWLALDPLNDLEAPRTPFEIEEYTNSNLDESMALQEAADEKFEEGKEASGNSDDYILAMVFFASVLFFSGISTKFRSQWIRSVSIVIAVAALSAGVAWLVSLPRLDVGV